MGGRASRYRLPPEVLQHSKKFRMLGLREYHVRRLYSAFKLVDKDMSGELSIHELLDHLGLAHTAFADRVFAIFDFDASGEISFEEFVMSLWNYCTLTKSSLIMFAFDLYDADSSGIVEMDEMELLLRDVYGSAFEKSRLAQQILEKIKKMTGAASRDCEISVDRFAAFCRNHPGLLFPAFNFQLSLQRAILGVQFWVKLARQRLTLPTGKQVSIHEILQTHVDETKFKELAMHDRPGYANVLAADDAAAGKGSSGKRPRKKSLHEPGHLQNNQRNQGFKDLFDATGTKAKRLSNSQKLQSASQAILAAKKLERGNTSRQTRHGRGGHGGGGNASHMQSALQKKMGPAKRRSQHNPKQRGAGLNGPSARRKVHPH